MRPLILNNALHLRPGRDSLKASNRRIDIIQLKPRIEVNKLLQVQIRIVNARNIRLNILDKIPTTSNGNQVMIKFGIPISVLSPLTLGFHPTLQINLSNNSLKLIIKTVQLR